eukprot:m.61918 g.61918  ORF g.61918 m.61918 type:complete len:207 (+) comp7110_c0_seq1:84-704(+)
MFSKKPDEKALARQSQRDISSGQRDLRRAVQELQRKEAEIVAEIKKHAKAGNKQVATLLAKQLVQVRNQQTRLGVTGARLSGASAQMTAARATVTTAKVMGSAAKALERTNAAMPAPKMVAAVQSFERESMKMDMAGDMIGDALDGLDGDDIDIEADEEMNKVFDEIGLDLASKLTLPPSGVPAAARPVGARAAPQKGLEEYEWPS